MTRGEAISRLRNAIREVNADSLFSNRYLWNMFETNSKVLLKQEAERGRVYSLSNIWTTICVEMESVSPIVCNCIYLPYDCMVARSKYKLPQLVEYSGGFIYRFIATPDLSKEFILVTPYQYSVKSKIKHGLDRYAFIHDGYLYTPKHDYPLLSISGVFIGDTSRFNCSPTSTVGCKSALQQPTGLPDYLEEYVIKGCLQELGFTKQIPADEHPNNNTTQTQVSP